MSNFSQLLHMAHIPSSTFSLDFNLAWNRVSEEVQKLAGSAVPWAVVDDLFGLPLARALAAEAVKLEEASMLQPHNFRFSDAEGRQQTFEHPGRHYIDLDPLRTSISASSPACLLSHLGNHEVSRLILLLQAAVPELKLQKTVPHVKLQLTHGHYGCTAMHYDVSFTAPSSLQLSILVYLSEGWLEDWGAHLQLLPFIGERVNITPAFDRAVIFLADRMLHRSLPPKHKGVSERRWLLTIWLDGGNVDHIPPGTLSPALQRHLSPALHSLAYIEALTQSIPPSAAREALIFEQQSEIRDLSNDKDFSDLLTSLQNLKDEEEEEEEDLANCRHLVEKNRVFSCNRP